MGWFEDNGYEEDQHLSPWEQAHGGEPYDPNKEYETNDFDRAVEQFYNKFPTGVVPAGDPAADTNWYDSNTWAPSTPPPPPPQPPPDDDDETPDPRSGGGDGRVVGGGHPNDVEIRNQSSGGGRAFMAAPRPYQPFTEQYTAPTWDRTFTAPTRPGDLLDPWTQTFSFDPSKIRDNPAYQVRLSDTIKAVDRGSAAKGLSFTNQAREELLRRAGALASTELENEFGRQLGGYQTNYNTFSGDRSRRGMEADRIFDESLGTYRQGRGDFESDRGFGRATYLDRADIHDRNETGRYGSERSNLLDSRAWDSDLWGRDRATRLDDRAWDQTLYGRGIDTWNMGRTDRNDQWGRGTDLWGMNRTDRQDLFENDYRLSDLILRGRPVPR